MTRKEQIEYVKKYNEDTALLRMIYESERLEEAQARATVLPGEAEGLDKTTALTRETERLTRSLRAGPKPPRRIRVIERTRPPPDFPEPEEFGEPRRRTPTDTPEPLFATLGLRGPQVGATTRGYNIQQAMLERYAKARIFEKMANIRTEPVPGTPEEEQEVSFGEEEEFGSQLSQADLLRREAKRIALEEKEEKETEVYISGYEENLEALGTQPTQVFTPVTLTPTGEPAPYRVPVWNPNVEVIMPDWLATQRSQSF